MCYTVPILFLFTRMVTDYHGFFFMSRIIELSNFSFSHGVPRNITGFSLSRIIELSNFSFHTEFHGLSRVFLYPELSNYRIFLFHTEFHGESRIYILVPNYRIIEFLFTRSSTENHGFIFCHEFANSKIRDIKKNIRDIP